MNYGIIPPAVWARLSDQDCCEACFALHTRLGLHPKYDKRCCAGTWGIVAILATFAAVTAAARFGG